MKHLPVQELNISLVGGDQNRVETKVNTVLIYQAAKQNDSCQCYTMSAVCLNGLFAKMFVVAAFEYDILSMMCS